MPLPMCACFPECARLAACAWLTARIRCAMRRSGAACVAEGDRDRHEHQTRRGDAGEDAAVLRHALRIGVHPETSTIHTPEILDTCTGATLDVCSTRKKARIRPTRPYCAAFRSRRALRPPRRRPALSTARGPSWTRGERALRETLDAGPVSRSLPRARAFRHDSKPTPSKVLLVHDGRAATDGGPAVPVRRYRLARVVPELRGGAPKSRQGIARRLAATAGRLRTRMHRLLTRESGPAVKPSTALRYA